MPYLDSGGHPGTPLHVFHYFDLFIILFLLMLQSLRGSLVVLFRCRGGSDGIAHEKKDEAFGFEWEASFLWKSLDSSVASFRGTLRSPCIMVFEK